MGMDMWLFKPKKKEEVKTPRDCWDWDSGLDFDETGLVPKDNPYLKGWICWGDEEYYLINYLVKNELNVKYTFSADPILPYEDFKYIIDMLNKWYEEKCNGRTKFVMKKEWDFTEDWVLEIPNIDKLVEYLTIAKDNGFTMWFSW